MTSLVCFLPKERNRLAIVVPRNDEQLEKVRLTSWSNRCLPAERQKVWRSGSAPTYRLRRPPLKKGVSYWMCAKRCWYWFLYIMFTLLQKYYNKFCITTWYSGLPNQKGLVFIEDLQRMWYVQRTSNGFVHNRWDQADASGQCGMMEKGVDYATWQRLGWAVKNGPIGTKRACSCCKKSDQRWKQMLFFFFFFFFFLNVKHSQTMLP